jgi:plastocyanin
VLTGATALAAASLLGACGSGSSSTTSANQASDSTTRTTTGLSTSTSASTVVSTASSVATAPGQVLIKDYDFAPNTITVKAGTAVTWTNTDAFDHWVVSAPGAPTAFDLGRQGPGKVVTQSFAQPGTYDYYCNLHNYMKGTVVVT